MSAAVERISPRQPQAWAQDTGENEDFLRILLRRYRLVLACVGIGLAIAVVAIALIPPRYSARAVMRVDTDDIDVSNSQSALASTRELELRRNHQIETQLQLLSSRSLMRQVVRTLALYDDAEFNPGGDVYGKSGHSAEKPKDRVKTATIPPLVVEAVTDKLMNSVRVSQDGQTSFLNIDVSSRSAKKAARIANKIASIYVQTQVSEKRSSNLRAIEALGQQVSDLREQLISIERGAAAFKREHRLDGTSSDDNRAGEIGQLTDALAMARSARAEAEVRAASSQSPGLDLISPLMTSLRDQETQTRRRLADLSTIFGQGHPDVQKTQAQLAEIQRSIALEGERVQQQLRRETSAQHARETQLGREVDMARSRSLNDVITGVPLADMERNSDATRAVYVALLGRLDGLVRENQLVRPDATIAFVALPPTSAGSPKASRILVIAVAGSVLLSLIIVLIVEQLDTRLRTAAQVQRLTGLPTFGMMPELRHRKRERLKHAGAIDRPYSAFTEEVRSICDKVQRLLPPGKGGIVLVSSPEPGDGKTTLALAMAAAAIAVGRVAIVVDLDLRRPELGAHLGQLDDTPDLIDYLQRDLPLEAAIRSCPGIASLKSLSARLAADDPGALIASKRLKSMLEELRTRFDVIILNTPPVLAVHDAASLATLSDIVLLVIGWGRTSRRTLCSAFSHFDGISGVVFNHVRQSAHDRATYEDYIHDYGNRPARWSDWRPGRRVALRSRTLIHRQVGTNLD